MVLAAKRGIHGPQRERRARAGPALHRAASDHVFRATARRRRQCWGAFEVGKGCRGGSRRPSSLSPVLPGSGWGGGGLQDKTRSRPQPGPQRQRQRENKQVWSQAHGAVSVPAPPSGMMDGCSQPARPPGSPAIYITLAFHRSPLTRHRLGPEARWPCGSSSHQGTETACEGRGSPASRGAPGLGKSRACQPASPGGRRWPLERRSSEDGRQT